VHTSATLGKHYWEKLHSYRWVHSACALTLRIELGLHYARQRSCILWLDLH
jgi:hypothetical protein